MCDVTEEFHHLMKFPYNSFAQFQLDLSKFQHATATSYTIRSSLSAANYRKVTGKSLPDPFPYRWLQYRCVHSRTRCKAVRNADCGCESKFTLTVRKKKLCLVRANFKHNHSFQQGKPWLYSRNRRLDSEQQDLVCSVMDSFHDSYQLRRFIEESFGRRLNRFDLRRLREANKKMQQSGLHLPDNSSLITTSAEHVMSVGDGGDDYTLVTNNSAQLKTETKLEYAQNLANDLIYEDVKDENIERRIAEATQPDEDLPGLGQYFCVSCSKHFINQTTLDVHRTSKPHKRRLRALREKPHTQDDADRAAGLLKDDSHIPSKRCCLPIDADVQTIAPSGLTLPYIYAD
ncbi:uncharacterized protein DEA37_0008951 [Paragonimus westermani]|uniref:C2H2-type domain-containing protein n=1 Tax=Paragonimus westermani TaxID=34504 RepID=A0A5J4NQQ3_9TREM|nr:uncharacterized protein DEA37_0008951 [Paragonimus westermani]